MNQVTLMGHVGKDPEIKTIQDNKKMAIFTLATKEVWKDKASSTKKERTDWHRIVVFNDVLVVSVIEKYIKQGSKILIQGALRTRKYGDDGAEQTIVEVVLQGNNSNIVLLGNCNKLDKETQEDSTNISDVDLNDEIPF